MTMHHRNVRVDDDVWERATTRAAREGRTLSVVIREMLTDYATPRNGSGRNEAIKALKEAFPTLREDFTDNWFGKVVDIVVGTY